MLGDTWQRDPRRAPRPSTCCGRSATRGAWCTREAMLGGIAQAEHRFDDAARALARAADESATHGLPRARPPCTGPPSAGCSSALGDPAAVASYQRAIAEALAVRRRPARRHGPAQPGPLCAPPATATTAVALLEENAAVVRLRGRRRLRAAHRLLLAAARDDEVALRWCWPRPGRPATWRSRSSRSMPWPGWRPSRTTCDLGQAARGGGPAGRSSRARG